VSDDPDPSFDSEAIELDGPQASDADGTAGEDADDTDGEPEGSGSGRVHRVDALSRPQDPAGTRPKVDPRLLESAQPQLALLPREGRSRDRPDELASVAHVGGSRALSAAVDSGVPPATIPLAGASAVPGAPRFHFLFGALGALALAVLALALVLIVRPGAPAKVKWSSWAPSSTGEDVAQQIAEHVGPQYRLPNGRELVKVTGGPQAIQGQPIVVAVRDSGTTPTELPSNGVIYQLCGEGTNCSIAEGEATFQRGLLVRREALELALYTFRYLREASQVLVIFPPPPAARSSSSTAARGAAGSSLAAGAKSSATTTAATATPTHVLLLRPSQVKDELSRPLDATLTAHTPSVTSMYASPDASVVNKLTEHALYDSFLTQQESTYILLLQPPSLGG
jgi:hypothetical protein